MTRYATPLNLFVPLQAEARKDIGSGQQITDSVIGFRHMEDPTAGLVINLDNGTAVLDTGPRVDVTLPIDGRFTGWTLVAPQVGRITLDIWKSTYDNFPPVRGNSITGGVKPALTDRQTARSTRLVGWNTDFVAGEVLRVNVDSVLNITRCTLTLTFRRL